MKRHTAKGVSTAEEDMDAARILAARKPPPRNAVCFHCQHAAEKYLQACLQELGAAVPRIHNLKQLLHLLLPRDATLAPLRRSVGSLTKFAVEYRYPGMRATTRQMQSALRIAERVRGEVRARLGLPP
jgi:HEPN domain-containing protein